MELHLPRYGVVVEYRDDAEPRYLIVETDLLGRHSRGPAVWRDADAFTPTGNTSRMVGRLVRRISQQYGPPELRGCSCYCCPHMDEGLEPDVDER